MRGFFFEKSGNGSVGSFIWVGGLFFIYLLSPYLGRKGLRSFGGTYHTNHRDGRTVIYE